MDDLKGCRILVVDDSQSSADVLAAALADYRVDKALSGAEGLRLARKAPPDLILLDILMPGKGGFEVCGELKADPDTRDIPVIFITSLDDPRQKAKGLELGAVDYITKPFATPEVRARVRTHLSLGAARAALAERNRELEGKVLEVARAEQRYESLIQNLPLVVFSLRPDFSLEFINNTCRSILGFDPEEARSDPGWLLSRTHPEDRERVRGAFGACFLDQGATFSLEFRFEHRRGYLVHLLARPVPCANGREPGVPRRMEGILADITERMFLDKLLVQRERLNTLGSMSAELAHEIRNPLFALGGFARQLHKKLPDLPEAEVIMSEARRLEQLLDRLTDYVKPVPTARVEPCRVNSILKFCARLLAGGFKRRQVSCDLFLDERIEPVRSDPDIMTQMFLGLLGNAGDISAAGGAVEVRTSETLRHVVVEVRVGRASVNLRNPELLFLPPEKDPQAVNLALSYRLAQTVGGYLTAEKNDPALTFTLALPKDEPGKAPL